MDLTPLQRLFAKLTPPSSTIWLDGRAVSLNVEVETIEINVVANQSTLILPEDTGRIWLGFQLNLQDVNTVYAAPTSNPVDFPFAIVTGPGGLLHFRLADYPGILSNKWYATPDNDTLLRIYNIRQLR